MTTGAFVSRQFVNKNGKPFVTRRHTATFNEIHNASRSMAYLVLYHRRYTLGKETGLGVRALSNQSGVDYDYIRAKIGKWVSWGFLLRKVAVPESGRPYYTYMMDERGKHFVEDILPREWREYYIDAIKNKRST
jgi:hypothetical protein